MNDLPTICLNHAAFMTRQMVNSSVATTRVYWRRMMGLPEDVVNDPALIEWPPIARPA